MKNEWKDVVLVQTYYTTEGDKVYEHRKIGEQAWEKILTPFTQVPYVINTYDPKDQLSSLQEKVK